jgi:DNA-binding PadR family transcriptional regulator
MPRVPGARASDPALLVLLSLAGGDKHGHALAVDIETLSGARPGPGTLYGAITRLEEQGLIEALPEDGRRRPYRLTGDGLRALDEGLRELRRLAAAGDERVAAASGRLGLPHALRGST